MFTLVFSVVVMTLVFVWLLMHRFRVRWLELQADECGSTRRSTPVAPGAVT